MLLWCSWRRGSLFVESSMSWVYGYDPETKSFRRFPYNKNPTRALNKTALFKCCLPSTDAMDKREKNHACLWGFKVASCKHASLKSTRFSQKKKRVGYFYNRVVYVIYAIIKCKIFGIIIWNGVFAACLATACPCSGLEMSGPTFS